MTMETAGRERPATWIWYPGDYEIWLHREVNLRRDERLTPIPPFWRLDTCYGSVKFRKRLALERPETVSLAAEGRYNVELNGRMLYGDTGTFTIPAGDSDLVISVTNDSCVPAIRLEGETVRTGDDWLVTCNNHKWLNADSRHFDTESGRPSRYKLPTEEIEPASLSKQRGGTLLDFGKETFGYLKLRGVRGTGCVKVYYGESEAEALSSDGCETLDEAWIAEADGDGADVTLPKSRALRYARIEPVEGVSIGGYSLLHEYLPLEERGRFTCSDPLVNRIWDTSVYTLRLNTREFFLDGIKRDRWVWSGDAYQSLLMNMYSFFDLDVNRRTWIALRGKDPVETHINHILDYSFYWFLGLYDHYWHTGDGTILDRNYERMVSLLEFCLGRRNGEGMVEGYPDDWVFVDWADIDKRGELSFEQLLLCRSLEIVALAARRKGEEERAKTYEAEADRLRERIFAVFWSKESGGLLHNRVGGALRPVVTKHANMMALLLGYLDERQARTVADRVLLSDAVAPITTPYMRFYELAALCRIGEREHVVREIKHYWGGMLERGATTFWEEFDPRVEGDEQYAMYGRPFGKSLCHAWGASPIYLLGKYLLGVEPLSPGYERFLAEPHLGGLEWIEGAVPVPGGAVTIYMDGRSVRARATSGAGLLRVRSAIPPVATLGSPAHVGEDVYELQMEIPGLHYELKGEFR